MFMQFIVNTGCSIQGDVVVTSDGGHDPQSVALVAQPSNEKVNTVFSVAPRFELLDKNGRRATTSTTTVTLSLTSGTGTLSGTLSARAVNGLATFSDLQLDKVGTGFSITASSAFGSSATSAFKVDYSPIVLGQPSFDRNLGSEKGFSHIFYSSSDGTRFFVPDPFSHRVMIWNQIPLSHESANVILGQPNKYSLAANNGGVSASSMWRPMRVHSDGSKIAVADSKNHRILIWNSIPTVDGAPANIVLGQADFTSNASGVSASAMNTPTYVYWTATKFFVVDSLNNRVMVWNGFPTTNNQAADYVLGQPDLISNTVNNGGVSAQSLNGPASVNCDGTELFVTDPGNHRVLIWNTVPTVTQQASDLVVGQPNLTSNTENNGGVGSKTLSYPSEVYSDGSKLYIMDYGNYRGLIWNTIPTTNFEAANVVIGQPDFTSAAIADSGGLTKGLFEPQGIMKIGAKLFVTDYENDRVMVWNTVPTVNHTAADAVIGQDNLNQANWMNGGVSAQRTSLPQAIYTDGQRLVVSDIGFNRVLIWNTIPTATTQAADIVLGQPDMTSTGSNNGGISTGLSGPYGICGDGTKLIVIDNTNHRALIWNTFPTATQQAANVVLGQPNMTTNFQNSGGLSAHSLWFPMACTVDEGGKLYIADQRNHRVLIWNSIPTVNATNADVVLGQPNFVSNTGNNGGVSAHSLNIPQGIYTKNGKLYVVDSFNHRILIWNTIPTANQANADVVLGQPDFASNTINNGGVSALSLNYPKALSVVGTKLYVSDTSNHRILIWNSIPTINQTAADSVLGQANLTSNTANSGGLSASSLSSPAGITSFTFDGNPYLLINDSGNGRVLLQP
jgi:hypothetical protein